MREEKGENLFTVENSMGWLKRSKSTLDVM